MGIHDVLDLSGIPLMYKCIELTIFIYVETARCEGGYRLARGCQAADPAFRALMYTGLTTWPANMLYSTLLHQSTGHSPAQIGHGCLCATHCTPLSVLAIVPLCLRRWRLRRALGLTLRASLSTGHTCWVGVAWTHRNRHISGNGTGYLRSQDVGASC